MEERCASGPTRVGLALAMPKRLDCSRRSFRDGILDARIVAEEFDEFLDIVCECGEGASNYLLARRPSSNPEYSQEAGAMTRLAAYLSRGAKA